LIVVGFWVDLQLVRTVNYHSSINVWLFVLMRRILCILNLTVGHLFRRVSEQTSLVLIFALILKFTVFFSWVGSLFRWVSEQTSLVLIFALILKFTVLLCWVGHLLRRVSERASLVLIFALFFKLTVNFRGRKVDSFSTLIIVRRETLVRVVWLH
jgi:hypothetical protein